MGNVSKIKPTRVFVELDKQRELKYDLNAYTELEKRFGSVEEALNKLQEGSMQSIKIILWVGLIHEEAVIDPDTGDAISYNITPYQVGGWISPSILADVTRALTDAIGLSMPEAPIEAEKTSLPIYTAETAVSEVKMATVVLTPAEQKEAEKKG
jgi:hypothetical protein